MRVLVVHCHPNPESFVAAVRDAALEGLRTAGHEVRLIDLYEEGFDPVLTREGRAAYHTAGDNEAGIETHLEGLRWCQGLILVYPTWWYGQPAMLKGWLDRVWIPHATFTMPEDDKPIGRVLTNIRLIGAITTLGSPRWWWWLMGMPGRRTILTGIGVLCAPGAKRLWLALHKMDATTVEERTGFLQRVRERMGRI